MSEAPKHLSDSAQSIWGEMVADGWKPAPGFDAYCNQLAIERTAAAQIASEGIIVADAKGNPVPHPALEIQRKAQSEVRGWVGKFRRIAPM